MKWPRRWARGNRNQKYDYLGVLNRREVVETFFRLKQLLWWGSLALNGVWVATFRSKGGKLQGFQRKMVWEKSGSGMLKSIWNWMIGLIKCHFGERNFDKAPFLRWRCLNFLKEYYIAEPFLFQFWKSLPDSEKLGKWSSYYFDAFQPTIPKIMT